jgi:response regulator RpfG family c-di-GMP phosphodiesterase
LLHSITLQWWSQLLTAPLAVVLAAVASRTENLWADLGLTAAYIVALPIARQEYIYYNRSRELLDDTVEAVVRALEGTDPDARAHGDRVSALAVETGRRMRLAERDLHTLRLASRLHDVGLLAGPDPHDGKYQHAAIGGQILEDFPDPLIAEYVKAHHTRWDASLKGRGTSTSIPLGARILAVAEVYDSARAGLPPFEAPLSREDAVRHLRSLAGTVLDPEVVEVFLHVVAERDEERP